MLHRRTSQPNRATAEFTSVVVALVAAGHMLLLGCASTPSPHRPTVDELIQESFDKSMTDIEVASAYEVIDPPPRSYTDSHAAIGSSVMVHDSADMSGTVVSDDDITDADELTFSEEFIETDVREALLGLAEEAGVDLVMGERVSGIVNTRIDDLSLEQAIEKILMPLDLYYARRGDQFIVASSDPDGPLFSYIASRVEYRPLHLDAKALVDTVPTSLRPYVQLISGANLILIEAPTSLAHQIADRFSAIDQPVPQVVLEAIICVVSPDSGSQFGLDWQHAVELNGANALKLGATGLALSSTFSRAGANAIFSDFASTSTFVKLLSEHGYLTIRASPHVMAKDGEKATIAINRETFFSIQPQALTNNDAFFFQQEIQKVESGISLDITPHIRGDVVTIDIEKAEVSEDIRNANTELAVNPFPIINRRSVSTTVHVKDGKTIVIGGLVQRETVDRVNRVPGLSKLPLLGYLFKTTQRQTRDAEVVIFISPRIVMPPTFTD